VKIGIKKDDFALRYPGSVALERRQNEWQKHRSQIPLATCKIVQFRTAVLLKATTNPPFRSYF
jgi:hypothetical protein